ncbi:hypothetical protein PRZ48_014073 [Zasmidium cellare]|uniref:F-box domain-containing protein n=1 Tax=Zasmidium cellare TaxID=395010 RepID=A0ABR0DZZ8_ZASCE|nr:hypothetical protein PRZ48_014073 [Zasmidium cellare]
MGLLDLPEEILLLVCQRLCQPDLYNACLTCKHLSKVAADALYHSPYLQHLGDTGSGTSLSHTVSTNLSHARLIRHLRFNYFHDTCETPQTESKRQRSYDASLVFEEQVPLLWGFIKVHCEMYSDTLALCLILYYATRLESLMLGSVLYEIESTTEERLTLTPFQFQDAMFFLLLKMGPKLARPNGSSLCDRLTTIILMDPRVGETGGETDGETGGPKHDLRPFEFSADAASTLLRLPTLKTFIASDLEDDEDDEFTANERVSLQPRISNITTLRLLNCNLSSRVIRYLLRCCKALESFHWTVTCGPFWNPEVNVVFADIWPEILYFAQSLRLLALYREPCTCEYPCTSSHIGTYDTLLPLQELQSLVLEESGHSLEGDLYDEDDPIVDHDLQELPANIKDFVYITYGYESSDALIDEVVMACQTRPAMRVELCGLDPVDTTYLEKLRAKYPGFSFDLSTRRDRGLAQYCILVRQEGRQEAESAADAYDKIIAAAYAPYAGQAPRSRPYATARSCEAKLQPGLLTPKVVPRIRT